MGFFWKQGGFLVKPKNREQAPNTPLGFFLPSKTLRTMAESTQKVLFLSFNTTLLQRLSVWLSKAEIILYPLTVS